MFQMGFPLCSPSAGFGRFRPRSHLAGAIRICSQPCASVGSLYRSFSQASCRCQCTPTVCFRNSPEKPLACRAANNNMFIRRHCIKCKLPQVIQILGGCTHHLLESQRAALFNVFEPASVCMATGPSECT